MISLAARKFIFKSFCFCIFTVTVACLVGLITNNIGFGFFFACLTLFSVAMLYMVVKWKCIGDVGSSGNGDDASVCWSAKPMTDYHYHYYHYSQDDQNRNNDDVTTNIDESRFLFTSLTQSTMDSNTLHCHHPHHFSTRTIATIGPLVFTSVSEGLSTMGSTNVICSSSSGERNQQSSTTPRPGYLRGGVMSDTDLFTMVDAAGDPPPYSTFDYKKRRQRLSLLLLPYEQLGRGHVRVMSQSESAIQHSSLINGKLISFYYTFGF